MPQQDSAHFDLVIIGGGPSGSIAAEGAVKAGLKVALIERDRLGGTCLNYGCDPANVMVRAGELLSLMRRAPTLGVRVDCARLDWPVLRAHIEGMIDDVRGGDGVESVRKKGIHLYQGHAHFLSPHTIEVGRDVLTADRAMIASGSMPAIPAVEGLEETGFLTHRDLFALESLPLSLVVLGGGPNAIELAQAYLNFGIDVSIVTMDPRILPQEDEELVAELTRLLRRQGMRIHTGADELHASITGSGESCLSFNDDHGGRFDVAADAILVCDGRQPALDGLGLDAAAVRHSPGGISVDGYLQTSASHILAVGDVTGIGAHTHVADYQAQVALHNILHPNARKEADYRVVPWKVFTQPEIGRVGLTELEARSAGYNVVTNSMPYRNLPRAITLDEREGLVKLVVDRESHHVLGGHVLGAYASEVIAQVALIMQHRLPVTAIRETLHVHPTMSEGVYWVADAIREILLTEPTPVP